MKKLFKKLKTVFKKEKRQGMNIEKNLAVFINEEGKEIKELVKGQESFKKYCRNSGGLFENYFIPGEHNDHKPKILRPKQLAFMALILVLLKLSVSVYLLAVYQEQAKMAENIVEKVFELINADRESQNLNKLKLNTALSASALAKAENMAKDNYFAHTSPDGRHPWDFINRDDYPYAFIGENLAMNFLAAGDVHAALMASPSHKKNILNGRYGDVGLAVVSGEINGKKTNILVEMFGVKVETAVAKAAVKETAIKQESLAADSQPAEKTVVTEKSEAIKILGTEKTQTVTQKADSKTIEAELAKLSPTAVTSPEIITKKLAALIPASSSTVQSPAKIASSAEITAVFADAGSTIATGAEQSVLASPTDAEPAQLDQSGLNKQPIQISRAENKKLAQAFAFMDILKIIYIIFLIFLILALLFNIFIRISIQHKSVLIQSALLIALAIVLATYNFDFLRNIEAVAKNIVLL